MITDNAILLLGAGSLLAFLALVLGRKRLARTRRARQGDSAAAGGDTGTRADHDRREVDADAGDGGGGDGGGD